jgi:hypothetical protein
MTTWNTLFLKKKYLHVGPTEFYDDLEYSIFSNNAYMWDQSWFMTLLRSLWCHKTSMEQGTLSYSSNRYDNKFARK